MCKPGPSCPRHPPGVSMVRVSMVRRTERRGVSEAAVLLEQQQQDGHIHGNIQETIRHWRGGAI